jgi:hypothetical protein
MQTPSQQIVVPEPELVLTTPVDSAVQRRGTSANAALRVPDDIFDQLIQDRGEISSQKSKQKHLSVPHTEDEKSFVHYKDLFTLADMFWGKIRNNDEFVVPSSYSKNETVPKKKIALKIYVQREERALQSGTMFVLCQDTLIQSFRELWGKKEGAVLSDSINDRIRLIGVLLGQEKHQIDYEIILGMKLSSTKRVDSDNPAVRAREAWARIALSFNNESIIVQHPENWVTCSDQPGYEDLNPNDPTRMGLIRSSDWLTNLYGKITRDYFEAYRKWTQDTGGGCGEESAFVSWKERDESSFTNYANNKLYLTWIYMMDSKFGHKLHSRYDPIPFRLDGNTSHDNSSSGSSGTKFRRSPTSQIIHQFSAMQESMSSKMISSMNSALDNIVSSINPPVRDNYHVRLNELLDTLNKNDVHIEKLMKRSDTGDVSAARRIKILEQQQDNLYDLIEKLQDGSAQSDSSTLS